MDDLKTAALKLICSRMCANSGDCIACHEIDRDSGTDFRPCDDCQRIQDALGIGMTHEIVPKLTWQPGPPKTPGIYYWMHRTQIGGPVGVSLVCSSQNIETGKPCLAVQYGGKFYDVEFQNSIWCGPLTDVPPYFMPGQAVCHHISERTDH